MKVKCDNKECDLLCNHSKSHEQKTDCHVSCAGHICVESDNVQTGMIIYLAGPMTGHENFNFDRFDQVRDYLKAAGHHPISPADIDRLFEGWDKYPPKDFKPTPDDVARYMRRDMNAIEGADAIYMMEGWAGSKDEFDQLMKLMDNFNGSSGALVEFAYAKFLKKQILLEIEGM